MTPYHNLVLDDFKKVNQLIIDKLYSEVPLVETIGHYIVSSGGKRLRPLLVLLSARACQYGGNRHITLATIIEFIHTATLLHDDVVDQSGMRRGRRTANALWDNSAAILVGDFIYSRSFQMIAKLGDIDIIKELSYTTNSIAEGEVHQLVNSGKLCLSEEDYATGIFKKTASLFRAAMRSGAILAKNDNLDIDQNTIDQLGNYGSSLGMAFQIRDDILDYSGSSNKIGKHLGDDLAEGKITLPLIYAMRLGDEQQKLKLQKSIELRSKASIGKVLKICQDTGALSAATKTAEKHSKDAIKAITLLGETPYKQALVDLARFSIQRDN